MPIYEFECTRCKNVIEVLQKISDPPIEKCEKCGGKMKKLISNTSFRLLGGGWYKTDYKNTDEGPMEVVIQYSTPSPSKHQKTDPTPYNASPFDRCSRHDDVTRCHGTDVMNVEPYRVQIAGLSNVDRYLLFHKARGECRFPRCVPRRSPRSSMPSESWKVYGR